MNFRKSFAPLYEINPDDLMFYIGTDRNGKPSITMSSQQRDVAFVSPACVTHWPRCTGDGNFGTMWGPSDISKAKYSLDLTDAKIGSEDNAGFKQMADTMSAIDDKLLDFVFQNQLKCLNGRKNLSREECKMLQIRSVRAKYDKNTGALAGHSVQLSTPKFTWDGMGGKYARSITICDHAGMVIENGTVSPGDVVAATVHAAQVYTGVGGDKFGIQWSFDDVSVICQRNKLDVRTEVSVFNMQKYDFSAPYEATAPSFSDQFPENGTNAA